MDKQIEYPIRYDPETGLPLTASSSFAAEVAEAADEPETISPAEQIPVQPPQAPQKLRLPSTRRELLLAVLLGIALALFSDTLFYAGAGLGLSVCLVLALGAEIWYLRKQEITWTPYAVFCAVGALALSVSLSFSDDGLLQFLAITSAVVLMTLLPMELGKQRRRPAGSFYALADFFSMLFVRTFGRLGGGFWALTHVDGAENKPRGRKLGAVLIGVGVAIPALAMVIPLLMSSDAAFDGMLRNVDLGKLPGHLCAILFGLFLAMLVFSQLFSVRHSEPMKETQPSGGKVDPVFAVSFLGVVSVVYVLYLLSQGAYFFDGFKGLLPKGYTVAEYARRGFFEMSAVCMLNLGFLLLAFVLTREKDGLCPLSVRLLGLFVCVFSLVLIATSISKMFLYIGCFGVTRLRILTSAFMLFLGCVFVAVIVRLFVPKTPYRKVAVIAAALIVVGLTFADVDRIVAAYNVRAYQTGKLDSIDMDTLRDCNDAAVPYLIELLGDSDPVVVCEAKKELIWRTDDAFETPRWENGSIQLRPKSDSDVRSFNTVTARAKRLLLQNAEHIFS